MKIWREFKVAPIWLLASGDEDGKSPREKMITEAYRDVGIAVERRILEICPNMSSGKKWDAIDFLFDEAFEFDPLEPDYQAPTLKKIDSVLKLIT